MESRLTTTRAGEALIAGSIRFRFRFLGFLGHLGLLGLLCFCCLLVCGLLRFLLVGSFGYDLATTGLSAGTSPVMLAKAPTTTLLAL